MDKKTVAITTLGCDKNRCDSEHMASILKSAGFELVAQDEYAKIIIVNTCAFINSARTEAIDTIISKFNFKDGGSCEKLIVTGCLPQKHRDELVCELPEVDLFIGIDEYEKLPHMISVLYSSALECVFESGAKLLSTPMSYAYIKIADGCNNCCSYCTIPSIRGRYRSRPQHEVLQEIEHLSRLGVPEFILVAQDLTKYQGDSSQGEGTYNLTALIRDISKISGVSRIRLHYVYPNGLSDELITEIATNEKVCKYLDIPLQHASPRIISLMNRKGGAVEYLALIDKLRARIPNLVIRSTFMVGFPTESVEDFDILCDFLRAAQIDFAGFFAYSREAGTASYAMAQVSAEAKKVRLKQVEKIQSEILTAKNRVLVGTVQKVVCDSAGVVLDCNVTRTAWQSPEVDPCVLVDGEPLTVGAEYTVTITGVRGKNLRGKVN